MRRSLGRANGVLTRTHSGQLFRTANSASQAAHFTCVLARCAATRPATSGPTGWLAQATRRSGGPLGGRHATLLVHLFKTGLRSVSEETAAGQVAGKESRKGRWRQAAAGGDTRDKPFHAETSGDATNSASTRPRHCLFARNGRPALGGRVGRDLAAGAHAACRAMAAVPELA